MNLILLLWHSLVKWTTMAGPVHNANPELKVQKRHGLEKHRDRTSHTQTKLRPTKIQAIAKA